VPRARPMRARARLESGDGISRQPGDGIWRWNLKVESRVSGAGPYPSLQLPCNLQPLAATATGRRSIVGRSGRLARGRMQVLTTARATGPWPPWSRRAPRVRREARRRACGHPQPAASFLACRGAVTPVAMTHVPLRATLSWVDVVGGAVRSTLSTLRCRVAADRGREGRRAACCRCVEPRAVPVHI